MKLFLSRFLALAGAALLGACGGGSLSVNEGQLRLVNATAEFPSLDLFASNTAVVAGVTPLSASGYGNLKANGYTLEVRASGTSTALVSASATVVKKQAQTVVAYTTAGSIAAAVLSDEEGDPSSGNAKLRIFHTANADAGAVDVYLVSGACSTLATTGVAAFATNLSGLQGAYTQVASSATPVHVCVTSVGDKSDVRLEIPSLLLSEKRIVTLIIVRGAGGVLLNGLVLDQQGSLAQALNSSARVRVAASLEPPTPASVTVNGVAVAAGLANPGVGPYIVVPAGALTVTVNGANVATTVAAVRGGDHTLLVSGPSAAPTLTLFADDTTPSTSPSKPVKIRLVNGLNGTTAAATLTVDDLPLDNGVPPLTASPYSTVPGSATSSTSRVEAKLGTLSLFVADRTLVAGKVYSVFLLGTPASSAARFTTDR